MGNIPFDIVVGAAILLYGWATLDAITGYRRTRKLRKEWRATVRAKYKEWGQEPPDWAKD